MKIMRSNFVSSIVMSVALFSGSVFAHATLNSAVPAADAKVAKAPAQVVLNFNEKLEGAFSNIKLTDGAGKEIKGGKAQVDTTDPTLLKLDTPELATGTYIVNWNAVGPDGHRRKGSYRFTVGQ